MAPRRHEPWPPGSQPCALPPTSEPWDETAAFPGVSPQAIAVRRRIAALAVAPGHALVLGETGTGKERVARAIAEPRKAHPFVTQNCGELDRELARSELFGHAAGAFSGATHAKQGLVDAAADGALFLDEIGELALDVQVDLLRFLEDGTYRAVGAQRLGRSMARVIAATNVDLDDAVAQGRFRRDLAGRLRASNAPLELPPLRARREDIPQWARLFLHEAGHRTPAQVWTVGALECLMLYPWLENLRELRGVVRALAAEHDVHPWPTEYLPERMQAHRNGLRGHTSRANVSEQATVARDPTASEIEAALRQTNGIVAAAAKLIGIERTKLYRLIQSRGVHVELFRDQGVAEPDPRLGGALAPED